MAKQSAVEVAQELLDKSGDVEDPWLISYADLVTNLLAFMVVLVSMAGINFKTIDQIPAAFGDQKKERPPLTVLSEEIKQLADAEGLSGNVEADVDTEGLQIKLQDKILFPSGVAALSPEGEALVDKLARLLSKLKIDYRVNVEGHTDDVPIATARFRNNWELSSTRALEVRQRLSSAGVDERRLSISAFADTRPVPAHNGENRDELRRRNRRVVLRVYY